MTNAPSCDLCRQPLADPAAYVCPRCTDHLRAALALVAKLAGEASVTISKQDRVGKVGMTSKPEPEPPYVDSRPGLAWLRSSMSASALLPSPMPYDARAAAAQDAAIGELLTWARHISEERGISLPIVRTETCRHNSCARIRRGATDGPWCDNGDPLVSPAAVLCEWLNTHRNLLWLAHRPEGGEAFKALEHACRTLERVVDRPAERVVVGQCPCGEFLYALRGKADVTCTGCGTGYDVEATRELLRRNLGESLFTAAEIATLAAYLGIGGSRERTRKLINKWNERRLLAMHDYQGEPAFRFGEVISKLAQVAS